MPFNRRTLLTRAAAAGAGMSVLDPAAAFARPRVPLTREEHRVVVIGSGFGGGVAALRLAQAGVPVLVLERGKRWPVGPNATTFPNAVRPDKRVLWHESSPKVFGFDLLGGPYAGLLDATIGDHITSIAAAGVGGGSLIYQGMTLQPAEDVFNACFPEELDWRRMDQVHYPRVAQMLQVAVAPDELVDSPTYKAARIFARNAERQGYAVEKIPMPIDWDYALAELRGEMRAAYTNGTGALGVNNGGKYSVDVTYLAQAEQTGLAAVEPLHNVTSVARARDGRWEIRVDRTNLAGRTMEQKIITAGSLIMAAGASGTSKLLVQAAGRGEIPDLPDALGEGWGTNADRIYAWHNPVDDFGRAQGGPVIYGSKEWDDPELANTVIQASVPPAGDVRHTTMLVGFGVSDGRGRFVYSSARDRALLKFPKRGDADVHRRIGQRVRAIAGPRGTLFDTNAYALTNTTWHGLGGACMGTVCDLEGRVQGQRGLYVLDGALIPGTTAACNPSMTIAAVAERAMDDIVAKDVGSAI